MKTAVQTRFPLIGEVYMVEFDGTGSVQKGYRPALVFQNNMGNRYSPNVVVLPVTSVNKKANQPTHVCVKGKESGLKCDSMVLCENPQCISKEQLGDYMTTLPEKYMKRVAAASLLATGAIAYLDIPVLASLMEKATKLNTV